MKAVLWCCVVALAIGSVPGLASQAGTVGESGRLNSGLRMAISRVGTEADRPAGTQFTVSIENVGGSDVVVNLGFMLANGRVMFPEAVRLLLTDPQGGTRDLQYFDRRYPGIAGRVDDFIVALRSGSAYSLRLSLDRYWSPATKEWDLKLAPGRYRIEALFDGRGAMFQNLDTPGIALLNFWKGTVRSSPLSFEVQ
jgi:hypothetical protein